MKAPDTLGAKFTTTEKKEGEVKHTYSYQLKHKADASLYMFTSSKFKTYFVLSTNCVLLADSIVGEAETDIPSPKVLPSLGLSDHLDLEFNWEWYRGQSSPIY